MRPLQWVLKFLGYSPKPAWANEAMPMRDRVLLFARANREGINAAQVAYEFQLWPAQARKRVNELCDQGHLVVSSDPASQAAAGSDRTRYTCVN